MEAASLTTTEIAQVTERVAIVPFGAFEQHGPALPLATDTYIAEAIAQQLATRLPETTIFFPTVWLGSSAEHRGFAGTLSLSGKVLMDVVQELLTWLEASGFRRAVVLNAHGGNYHFLAGAAEEYSRSHLLKARYHSLFSAEVRRQSQTLFGEPLSHGGCTEASLLAALRPDVRQAKPGGNVNPIDGKRLPYFEVRAFALSGVIDQHAEIRVDGDKGKQLAETILDECVQVIAELITLTVV